MDTKSELSLIPDRSPTQSPQRGRFSSPDQESHQENRVLKTRLYQIQQELQVEQDMVSTLRRKLNTIEKDRLDAVGKANDQVAKSDSKLTCMRAAVEKGEAVRQNLEYELAKLRRELVQDKRAVSDREALMNEVNDSMKHKVSELSHQMEHLCQELAMSKARAHEEVAKLNLVINEKELDISSLRTQNDLLEEDKEKAETALTQQEASVTDLENRIKELEDEHRSASEGIRRQASEMDLLREREQRFMRDLEAAMARIKDLEEGIEAERAAHLESKFNSEIVQLRIRDLEGALDVEKTSKGEALESSDKLAKQIKELQHLYEDQQRESIQSREKLEKDILLKCVLPATRAEKEYALINQQLQTDLEKKKHVIGKLSKQLELHQKNFDELKDELNKAKKRQIFLEETYGGSMRELELLLNNFNLDSDAKKARASVKTKKKDSLKSVAPSAVPENLRHTLLEYKQRLDHTATELTKLKSQHDQLAKECDSYKDMIWSKDKALENTSQSMTKSSKELQRLRAESSERERQLLSLRSDSEAMHKQLEKERAQTADLKQQMVKIATKCKTDEQAHLESLHGMYTQLLSGRISAARPSNSDWVSGQLKFTWNELLLSVQEEVTNMMHAYHRTNEKLQHVESLHESKEAAMTQMQVVHDEQLTKLAGVAEDKGQAWHQQKDELEEHYGQLLAEMHHRHKKMQSLTDQAWEKVRVMGTVQQSLETEVTQLRQQIGQYESERNVLLTTCSLICGAIYPLYAKTVALSSQRHLLQDQNTALESFRLSVQKLVGALDVDMEAGPKQTSRRRPRRDNDEEPRRSPLLRFRSAVISVIAANRLVHMAKGHCRLFIARDALPGLYCMSVCAGGIQPKERVFAGVSSCRLLGDDEMSLVTSDMAVSWLTSTELLTTIMATMSDLQPALLKARTQGSAVDMKVLLNTVRNSFTKLMCHLPSNFAVVSVNGDGGLRDRPSLLRALGNGLRRILVRTPLGDREAIVASQATLSNLQQQVLAFTKRLHSAEVERRDLRMELTALRQERHSWKSSVANTEHISAQLTNFKDKVDAMVPRDQFDSVCRELDQALSRERQSQELLSEQSLQLKTLSQRYEHTAKDGSQKEQSLADSLQNLSEARQDLKQQEQLARQLQRQVSQLEHEKKLLQTNIADAENALRTTAKDKELVTSYVKSVEQAIDRCKLTSVKGPVDLTPILSPDLIPHGSGRIGPVMSACQLLVTAFVDSQAQLNNRVRGLQEELTSHRSHVNSLKRELSAACKRELEDEMDMQYIDREPTKDAGPQRIPSPSEGRHRNNFIPLVEETDDSFTAIPRAVYSNQVRSKYTQDKPAKTKKAKKTLRTKAKDSSLSRSARSLRHSRPAAGSQWQSRTGLSSST